MGKLTHIEDSEQASIPVEQEIREQDATSSPLGEPIVPSVEPERQAVTETSGAKPVATQPGTISAQDEAAFHGLDDVEPMGAGHKALIALAIIVVVITVVYVLNTWLHFL